jgi:hypothetical protein
MYIILYILAVHLYNLDHKKHLFHCRDPNNLLALRNILITYVSFSPGWYKLHSCSLKQLFNINVDVIWMLFFVFILSFTLRLSISYSFPDIGYTQGMNDLVSRFHVVLKSEYKTYYCFLNFMERVEKEFLEDGMISKLG